MARHTSGVWTKRTASRSISGRKRRRINGKTLSWRRSTKRPAISRRTWTAPQWQTGTWMRRTKVPRRKRRCRRPPQTRHGRSPSLPAPWLPLITPIAQMLWKSPTKRPSRSGRSGSRISRNHRRLPTLAPFGRRRNLTTQRSMCQMCGRTQVKLAFGLQHGHGLVCRCVIVVSVRRLSQSTRSRLINRPQCLRGMRLAMRAILSG
mmetsp:Transcript_13771/g.44568  ORF Transcript_13771/g.44568 Transcript_13771/m.44568 type:complete len:205 (-) Transcript_13771:2373-2987(-)